eukprot:784869-Amorphochlora_amoeboformis.AAC.2
MSCEPSRTSKYKIHAASSKSFVYTAFQGEKAPTSRIDFGLYECTSYFFDDKHGHSTQYAKLKQSNDVKVLRFTGIGVR